MWTRRGILAAGAALATAPVATPAGAAWPDRPIRLIVPFGAGGNLDTLMRLTSPGLSQRLGQSVVIENRVGAGGNVGTEMVARAAPDGYTILVGSNGALTINPVIMASVPYDTQRDFAPVALGFRTPNVLVVAPNLPAQNLRDFIAYAKANPGKVACASPGSGTSNHLLIELFNQATGAGLVHVPYRSSSNAAPDMLAGNLAASMDQITTALPFHREGKLRIIGIGYPSRHTLLPEVPTFAEVGLPDGGLVAFIGLLAPAGTPQPVIQRLRNAFAETLAEPAVRERVEATGTLLADPTLQTPEGFADLIRHEATLSREAAKLAGLVPS
jgi:tripartite-type tricarboxylate transporter receptor subunit TctC